MFEGQCVFHCNDFFKFKLKFIVVSGHTLYSYLSEVFRKKVFLYLGKKGIFLHMMLPFELI